jgi:SWIM zinc finger
MRSTDPASKIVREAWARKVAGVLVRDIAESAVGVVYKIPTCTDATYYVVSLSRGTCECKDFQNQGTSCEHLLAAEIVNAKSATCEDCNGRFLARDL